MSTMTSPFLRKNGVNMLIFKRNFKMSNNNSPTKMSTYANYLGQVHNKFFKQNITQASKNIQKTSHNVITTQ